MKNRGIYANGCMNCEKCGQYVKVSKFNNDQKGFETSDIDGEIDVISVVCNKCYEKYYI
jgi:hypothetical protein